MSDVVPSHYVKYGLGREDVQYARAFEASFKRTGWSPTEIDCAFRWYRDHVRPGASPTDLANSFVYTMQKSGISEQRIDQALATHSVIAENGPDAIKPLPAPSPDQDKQRLAELQGMMKARGSDYWQDERLQSEHYEILERQESAGLLEAPAIQQEGN